MKSNLIRVVQEYNRKKPEDGKSPKQMGKLTNARIDAIQNFYEQNIRDNKGNVLKVSEKELTILDHYSSTIWKPSNENYPKGPQYSYSLPEVVT